MNDAENEEGLVPYPASAAIEDKIEVQHAIAWSEVDEVFETAPHVELIVASDQYGEPRYAALGQTDAGRYLYVVFVPIEGTRAKVITAREMDNSERRRYKRR